MSVDQLKKYSVKLKIQKIMLYAVNHKAQGPKLAHQRHQYGSLGGSGKCKGEQTFRTHTHSPTAIHITPKLGNR